MAFDNGPRKAVPASWNDTPCPLPCLTVSLVMIPDINAKSTRMITTGNSRQLSSVVTFRFVKFGSLIEYRLEVSFPALTK